MGGVGVVGGRWLIVGDERGENQCGKRRSILRFWPGGCLQRRFRTLVRNAPAAPSRALHHQKIPSTSSLTSAPSTTSRKLVEKDKRMLCILLLSVASVARAEYYPFGVHYPAKALKEAWLMAYYSDWIRNQKLSDIADIADSLLSEYPEKPKEIIPVDLPGDYDGMDILNPNPSLRDQEYLRHSTLWSHQRMRDNDKINDRHRIKPHLKAIKDEKSENALPAYCTPPNPCPVGYTRENNCLEVFENTATFSREYQSAQDCMCDTEHMLDCPIDSVNTNNLSNMHITNSNFDQMTDEFQEQEENPFFRGEKLPIAAKKGLNVTY